MKLQKSDFKSEVYGAEKEMSFSIDTSSSVIFDILRDKMYTNKISAICREVSSNSRDANIEANRSEIPINISIVEPFELDYISDMSIVFGDCGLGITPDRMSDVFIKYASSTKRSSNEQVGGFGLGAKTPFAYSDTFTIITVCDTKVETGVVDEGNGVKETQTIRMKYIYTAMIDDTQKGKMVLFEQEESDEPTGTQIIVPINSSDRYEFEQEIHRATCLWETRPNLSGFIYTFGEVIKLVDEENLTIIHDETTFFYSLFLVVIDGIPYKLDRNLFTGKFDDIVRYGFGEKYPIVLYFKTGELSISANREGIHYTEQTKQLIEERLQLCIDTITKNVKNYISSTSYLEACIRVYEIYQNEKRNTDEVGESEILSRLYSKILPYLNLKLSDIIVEGESLRTELKLKYHYAFIVQKSNKSGELFSTTGINKITQAFRSKIIFNDLPRRDNKRSYTLLKDSPHYILITPTTKKLEEWVDENGVKVNNQLQLTEFNEQQKLERDWINTYLVPSLYSSIPQTEITSISQYKYQQQEEIDVPVRVIDSSLSLHPGTYRYYRSLLNFKENFLYYVVPSLEDSQHISNKILCKMIVMGELLNLTPVIVSKVKSKYFDVNGNVLYTDTGFDELLSIPENITLLHNYCNSEQIKRLTRNITYSFLLSKLPELIPNKFQFVNSNDKKLFKGIQIWYYIDGLKVDDLLDQWEDYKKELQLKYPLIQINHYYFLVSELDDITTLQHTKDYIKWVNSREEI